MINNIISEARKRTTVLKRQQVTVAPLNCNLHSKFVSMLANIEQSQRDAELDVPCACTQGAVHSKIFKSRISAHRHAYRASLRSSSELEPRHPPLKVLIIGCGDHSANTQQQKTSLVGEVEHKIETENLQQIVQMILPQVHLRKPCYDFSFL